MHTFRIPYAVYSPVLYCTVSDKMQPRLLLEITVDKARFLLLILLLLPYVTPLDNGSTEV